MRCTRLRRELLSSINLGRLAQAQQFGNMDGWQSGQDEHFDRYVAEKRTQQQFDAFDQRVERAYKAACRAHRGEVVHAMKQRLRDREGKFTAQTALDLRQAVADRLHWLREVWAQVDADYRSSDPARQAMAAKEVSAALRQEPSDYMQWVYETKRDRRFLGAKGQAALDAELAAHMEPPPSVSDEEVNRYHNLRLDMSAVERAVKTRYGVAGQQHWAQLQAAKDSEYEAKLDQASAIYQQLIDQGSRQEESRRTALQRSVVERVHQAQVRFHSAMQLEREREQLQEAHTAMQEERAREAKARRVALLKESAALRERGASSAEVRRALAERQWAMRAEEQAEEQRREREGVLGRKAEYLEMIAGLREAVERREGSDMMTMQPQRDRASHSPAQRGGVSVFGFDEEDAMTGADRGATSLTSSSAAAPSSALSARRGATNDDDAAAVDSHAAASSALSSLSFARDKSELWRRIDSDHYEEPFRTVHQARLDAAHTYDPLYSKFHPTTLAQGKKYGKQGMGEYVVGGGNERLVLQQNGYVAEPFQWGMSSAVVHNLDGDGARDYFVDRDWHVRDKETGDIDWRYERRRGGATFRGPRLYKLGAEREARDAGEASVDPQPWAPPARRRGESSTSSPNTTSWRSR